MESRILAFILPPAAFSGRYAASTERSVTEKASADFTLDLVY